jgi:hypothetical protein
LLNLVAIHGREKFTKTNIGLPLFEAEYLLASQVRFTSAEELRFW